MKYGKLLLLICGLMMYELNVACDEMIKDCLRDCVVIVQPFINFLSKSKVENHWGQFVVIDKNEVMVDDEADQYTKSAQQIFEEMEKIDKFVACLPITGKTKEQKSAIYQIFTTAKCEHEAKLRFYKSLERKTCLEQDCQYASSPIIRSQSSMKNLNCMSDVNILHNKSK